MSRILSRDTAPEISVRRALRSMGQPYRLNVKEFPGKPDIVLTGKPLVVFVHGCFWHLHSNCRDGTIPKTRINYWREKLLGNKKRDARHMRSLRLQGWKVLRLWECEIERKPEKVWCKLKHAIAGSLVKE